MPLLARHVYQDGYRGGVPTEYLILVQRYVRQARELQAMAAGGSIRVANCDESGKLLQILGYRLQQGCGSADATLQTSNPERAFLTVDSGFPITDLEEALQHNSPFVYAYPSSPVPILFQENDWAALSAGQRTRANNCVDILLNDPAVARLYWALGETDLETGRYLQRSIGLGPLMSVVSVLDLYGGELSIRSGRVLVPGGVKAEPAWRSLVGASPQSPAAFVMHLYAKDDGWLAAYFDVLSRVDATQQEHLTQASRLQQYYEAFRAADKKTKAGDSSFRKAADLLVLDTRLTWEANGDPHVPGSLEVWKRILQQHSTSKGVREWVSHGHSLDNAERLIEALTASSRDETESGPLQLYLTLCELDRKRGAAKQVSPETVGFLAAKFAAFNNWYLIFSEFPALSDESIVRFIDVAQGLEQIRGQSLRANALGAFQANVGLWQILARQREIPDASLNSSWLAAIEPFTKISSSPQLFDSSFHSLRGMLRAAGGARDGAPSEIIERLAGPVQESAEGQRIHGRLVARMESVLEDQQLVSLDTLFALGDGLEKMAQGAKGTEGLVLLAGELRGFELPRAIFTKSEKASWAPGVYMSRHTELQVQTDLAKVIKVPATRAQLETARGQLAAFLRDTLVGLNYAYYEPPGAQILHINPLFVRAHDFLCTSVVGAGQIWQAPELIGAGVSAGGGAYLMGSLADLPFSLASAEQDFIVPENIQALIWKEVVPDLVTAATLPRWWDVSPSELHAVALYQRSGEELLRASTSDLKVRAKVIDILSIHMSPHRLEELEKAVSSEKGIAGLVPRLMPADMLYLAERYRAVSPEEADAAGPASKELAELIRRSPADVGGDRLSIRFGVPHPILARNNTPEILNVPPFPSSSGYTNRLFGESLESTNLYWARLADELGYPPAMLHLLVPELTRIMIGKIFASDMEDWPAVLRAMQETGDDLRRGKIASLRKAAVSPSPDQAMSIGQNP